MSIFNDKALKGVAAEVAKIMGEELKGNQHKIDANKNGKIDSQDFKLLRAGKKPEMKKEETEQLQEYESKGGSYKHKGSYGSSYNTDDEDDSPKRAQKGYGAHQNKGVRGKSEGTKKEKDEDLADTGKRMKPGRIIKTKTGLIHKMNESLSFTEMLELYNEHGLKVLAPIETEEEQIGDQTIEVIDADKINGVVATAIEEEATEEEFNKELKDQQASFAGKKKQPPVAAGKTTGVKTMPEEVELDERTLTPAETAKKEQIVKSMKKGLSGFKQRYGERAKEVMYATATKQAKKD